MSTNLVETINRYGFEYVDRMTVVDGIPILDRAPDWGPKGKYAKKTGFVYLWVKLRDGEIHDVAYVGKAGKTVHKRFNEHRGGVRDGNKKAMLNRDRLAEWTSDPRNTMAMYARHSPIISVNDELLSSYGIDEESFILKFKKLGCDLWNFFPG